eukprot:TRINITY_DN6720_c0_g1_i1.p2 TRINITY_DN6720_c0_g1~~TRINITY_DN6720_c0_g1_i1.p2  ORF type:complete len:265 (-),score=32.06 TRINITY_DN6720_c0_g1_i1:220-1014(-)
MIEHEMNHKVVMQHPETLNIPLVDAQNAINWLWRQGISHGAMLLMLNAQMDWISYQDIKVVLRQISELVGERYCAPLVDYAPWILKIDFNLLKKNVEWLKQLNFDSKQIVKFFKLAKFEVLALSIEKKDEKIQALKSYGLDLQEVVEVLIKEPFILLKDIKSKDQGMKIEFCFKFFGSSSKDIIMNCPIIFRQSLKDKIGPRLSFAQSRQISLGVQDLNFILVKMTDEDFVQFCQTNLADYQQFQQETWKSIWLQQQRDLQSET